MSQKKKKTCSQLEITAKALNAFPLTSIFLFFATNNIIRTIHSDDDFRKGMVVERSERSYLTYLRHDHWVQQRI